MLLNTDNTYRDIFLNAKSVNMLPVISAEWNQNLFNPPYLMVTGDGTKFTPTTTSTISSVTGAAAHPVFTTNSFATTTGTSTASGSVLYTCTTNGSSPTYKIVTYMMTSQALPVLVSSYAKDSTNVYTGSTQTEINNYGWTKIETYIGGAPTSGNLTTFSYNIVATTLDSSSGTPTIYFTVPEVYVCSYFDYQYHTLWDPYSVVTNFRPGESYVTTGDYKYSLQADFRKISSPLLNGYAGTTYSPVSSIVQNPNHILATQYVPLIKNVVPTDINPYKYFVSDTSNTSLTALYQTAVNTNKLVFKFNTMVTIPTVQIKVNGTAITVDGTSSITVPSNGVLVIYWNGSQWTQKKWGDPTGTPVTTMPYLDQTTGALSLYTSLTKLTVTQLSKTINSAFTTSNTTFASDANRMHLIEMSPRLEIDLSNFVEDVTITKALDSKSTVIPLSTINPDDLLTTLSGIPAFNGSSVIPVLSNQSNKSTSILANMLRKNIKIYSSFNLISYTTTTTTTVNTYIPGGIYYVDTWDETDIKEIKVQCYDITRYLQTVPVADYVANLKGVLDIVSNILDLTGFTDYDYDSLYKVCNDPLIPMELSYFYCNSKDTTLVAALNSIFLAYQIGCFIDEYGVMRFLSLSNIINNANLVNLGINQSVMSIDDNNIVMEGYGVTNSSKVGMISIRYQSPKILQSLALQNATDPAIKNTASFIYTTSNDVVWQQGNTDSVGFNYLASSMAETDSSFQLYQRDLLNQFHTYSLNNNGYSVIEDEIVSFEYKQYLISNSSGYVYANVKNDIELQAEINKFIKKYQSSLTTSDGTTKGDYNVTIVPQNKITNVQRGLFGTTPVAHNIITSLASKNLSSGGSGTASISTIGAGSPNQIEVVGMIPSGSSKVTLYPTSARDIGYKTYSIKFGLNTQDRSAAGLFFNASGGNGSSGYFVELVQVNTYTPETTTMSNNYNYYMIIYNSSGVLYWANVTGEVNAVLNNFAKVLVKQTNSTGVYSYTASVDEAFHLRVSHYTSDGTDGEAGTASVPQEVFSVFLNNVEITGWEQPTANSVVGIQGWTAMNMNTASQRRQRPYIPTSNFSTGTYFGGYMSNSPQTITNISYVTPVTVSATTGSIREIYATVRPLLDKSVNYWYQTKEFLNGMIQGQNIFKNSTSYMMQTTPSVTGINSYDIQYTTPAATSVDILPVEYNWYYYPGNTATDQQYLQLQVMDEYSASYSSVINTGFRGKFAIANNSPQMVYLTKQSDDLNQFTVTLNVWTHDIVAVSDVSLLERVIDPGNTTEVAQVDTQWIQSETAANRMMGVISNAIDGFSKDTSLTIFGNPLIQVGDIITLTYHLVGLNAQQYVVQSVKHSFQNGLQTDLVLNMVGNGTSY